MIDPPATGPTNTKKQRERQLAGWRSFVDMMSTKKAIAPHGRNRLSCSIGKKFVNLLEVFFKI